MILAFWVAVKFSGRPENIPSSRLMVCASPAKCIQCENSQSLSSLEHWLDPDANYKYPFHHASYGYPPKKSYIIDNAQYYQELYFLNGAILSRVSPPEINASPRCFLTLIHLITKLVAYCAGISASKVWCPCGAKISQI